MLDGGQEPVADMGEIRRLPADENPALDRAGGEIETE
jgi:hypothetical protein